MTIHIKMFEENYARKWDDFVLHTTTSSFYHQIGWMKVIEESYKYKPYYFLAENDLGEIVGILPMLYSSNIFFGRKLTSIAFAPYGGICWNDPSAEGLLITGAIERANRLKVNYCELRTDNSAFTHPLFTSMRGYSTFRLNLTKGEEQLWGTMDRKTRNMVRKGENNKLVFKIESNSDAISQFYEIYAENMKRLGTPCHSVQFFKNIGKKFHDNTTIAMVEKNGINIASLILLKFKKTLISGWGASLGPYLKYAPNNLLYWHSIKYACQNGYHCFDFGRSLIGIGTYYFKSGWGTVEIPLTYWYYPSTTIHQPPQNQYGKFSQIWRYVPMAVTKKIGPFIRGNLP